ncbi:hypothetical protein [Prescottella agglutinans]|uniref:hypothetical protein n=1 Tax=Prescottella agglutinans TaxID=1644129 RepID=UPI003D979AA6
MTSLREGWREVMLGDFAEVTVGHVGSMASEYVDDGVVFLRSQNVVPHGFDLSDVKCIPAEFHSRLRKSALSAGDVVTVRTGSPGATAVVPKEWDSANCSDLVITRPGSEIDSYWLSYYINSVATGFVNSMLVGAVQQHFNVGAARSMVLELPPIHEQRAIAAVLGALDDKIAANRKLAASAEALLAAELQALHFDQDVDGGDSRILTDYFDLNPACPRIAVPEPVYVDMQKLPTSSMMIEDWESRPSKGGARFMNGDTLLARITPCLQNRKTGYVDFLGDDEVAIGSTEYIVIRAKPGVPRELSYFLATSERFRTFAVRHMVGTSGRQRLSANDLTGYQVRAVDPAALNRWGAIAGPLVEQLGVARDESRTLAATRDALLPRLMSGELRVRDAERQVEEVL